MAQWDLANLVSMILNTQTDADSPGSQALMDKIRWMLETLFILGFSEGTTGTVDSVSGDTLTDTGAFTTDEHNGRTLLITDGDAKGYIYTITDTTVDTLVCSGENLVTDGVQANDNYRIFYDLLVNTDGHDHDGINSKALNVARGFAFTGGPDTTDTYAAYSSFAAAKTEVDRLYIYKTSDMDTVDIGLLMKKTGAGADPTIYVDIGASATGNVFDSSSSYVWKTMQIDISGESNGWLQVRLSIDSDGTAYGWCRAISGNIT